MDQTRPTQRQRFARTSAAVAAAAMLVAGAAWRGSAADSTTATAQSTVQSPAVTSRLPFSGRESYSDVVKAVAPGVVTIRVEGSAKMMPTGSNDDEDMLRRFFGPQFGQPDRDQRTPRTFKQRGLGSGVVVTPDGYILTNNHVIESADDIQIELADGKTYKAKVVGADKPSDLALLKVDAKGLPAVALGNSDAVEVGDVVLAFGNPLGIGQTVTMGIVSAKGRSTESGDGSFEDFLQTDAPINRGNSGGALVNLKGELVGINSQIVSPSSGNIGIGFAIPTNMARHVMDSLRTDGRVRRSRLGVTIQPVTAEIAESLGLKDAAGAIVSSVEAGSAADRAGIKRGDIVKSFNGQPVRDINTLRNHVADVNPGTTTNVVIVRDGSERTLSVKLEEAAASKTAQASDSTGSTDDKAVLGVTVAPLTPELAARANLPKDARGVVVQGVNPDGRAADAGIEAGDVILEVNRQAVQNIDDLRAALGRNSDRPTLLLVSRDGRDLFVTVKPS